jgi:hypothetical protein
MTERRYTEEEVAQIFERATEAQKALLPTARPSEGLTLKEVLDIGGEVGLAPDLVAQAARALHMTAQVHGRKVFGLPVGVGRTVELARPLEDAEWHRLVSDLRETFDARGRLSEEGPFKQWTNGNLQALLEPTATGQRLRLKTLKGSAMSLMSVGFGMTGVTAVILTVMYLRAVPFAADSLWTLFFAGLVALVAGAIQVPGWARQRSRQMEDVIERLSLMIAAPGRGEEPDAEER